VTCHDGFTLNDLFSYNDKHNEVNQEDNKDGGNDNNSWNCGSEGQTDDLNVIALRRKMIKNAISILMFSSGTPLFLYGDEVARTQKGNNNPYCQNNEMTWLDWQDMQKNSEILEFFKKAIVFRKQHPVLAGKLCLPGNLEQKEARPEISWFGRKLSTPLWKNPKLKILCFQIEAGISPTGDADYYLYFILNMFHRGAFVFLPQHQDHKWHRVVDTAYQSGEDFLPAGKEKLLKNQNRYHVDSRSVAVLISKK
jgi:glycogen operon protein